DSKIPEIQEKLATKSANSVAFVWITDTHWASNDKHSPEIIRELLKRTNLDCMIHGGDVITGSTKKSMIHDAFNSLNQLSNGCMLPVALGNHDTNIYGSDGKFSYSEMLSMYKPIKSKLKFTDYPNSLSWFYLYKPDDGVQPSVGFYALDTNDTG
ncbi:metallophosphoesterase, partial [Ligilactobacillus equi]|uniref:metallophosphoesterase n=1 Tax=Ligilactobacillus equi TaxID=137357 RepID=UPI00055546FD